MTAQVKQRLQDPAVAALVNPNVRDRIASSDKIEPEEKIYLLRLIELRDAVFSGAVGSIDFLRPEVKLEHLYLFETMFDAIKLFGKVEQSRTKKFDF